MYSWHSPLILQGRQLIRLAMRRRCERATVTLLESASRSSSHNAKKHLVDHLLAALNMWNMRATLLEMKLMLKEGNVDSARHGGMVSAGFHYERGIFE